VVRHCCIRDRDTALLYHWILKLRSRGTARPAAVVNLSPGDLLSVDGDNESERSPSVHRDV
jgi:hypothetical protein